LIYGLRGLAFVLCCILIPYINIPPKLKHLIGLLLESISIGCIGCSSYLGFKENINIICIGFIIQGLGSPCKYYIFIQIYARKLLKILFKILKNIFKNKN